jgi:hypothetical protein
VKIKFVSKTSLDRLEPLWQSFLPRDGFLKSKFTFDPDARDYDYLAVYEDLPPRAGERKILRVENLSCPADKTIIFVTEPSSIRLDGLHYLAQFGRVVTSRPFTPRQRDFLAAKHTQIDEIPCLVPFYGRDMEGHAHLHIDDIESETETKSLDISTVTSTKAMSHTVHAQRIAFVKEMKSRLGDTLDLFGRGIHAVDRKADAMRPYRYHIAIENHCQAGHFTEKLTDCFLARSLPFYFGDPEYAQRFPKGAVIPIDIFNAEKSEAIIRDAIASQAYEARREALEIARHLALQASNPLLRAFHWAEQDSRQDQQLRKLPQNKIYGRHAFRRRHPAHAVIDAIGAAKTRRSPLADPLQGYHPL